MQKGDPARKDTRPSGSFERNPVPKTSSRSGYLYLAVIGFSLALMGGLFIAFLGRAYLRAKETRSWDQVPAVILVSKVKDRQIGSKGPVEYSHELVYEYEIDGKFYQGERLKRRENP